MEQTALDGPLAQTGIQNGFRTLSAAPPAHPYRFWKSEGKEDTGAAVCRGRGGDVQVLYLQEKCQGRDPEPNGASFIAFSFE